MHTHKLDTANKQIRFVTNLALAFNAILFVLKVLVGLFSGSLALFADGIHSLSDISTDLAVLLGVYLGSKQPDKEHPYGHGRAETLSAGFIALVLTFVGAAMIYYATIDIVKGNVKTAHLTVLVAAVVSIIVKEWLYRITKKVAVESHSSALYANAWHHRSDALSSVAVVVGFIALEFGFGYGDQIAAIAVGLMIVFVGVRIIGDCLRELTEGAIDSGTIEHIENIIAADNQIRQWHKLRTRMVGREVFLDLHILVDPALSIADAHEISETLENTLHEQISRPVNITVHIEPDVPALRK